MKLFFRETGSGTPLVILHGLYGSSDNWMSIARQLAGDYHVILPDQRNHGQSPHSPVHDYPSLVSDLEAFVHDRGLDRFILMGHSMGGKTAIYYALQHPEKVEALIAVDISPRTYRLTGDAGTSFSQHKKMMEALLRLDLSLLRTRQEATDALAGTIPSLRIRQFLLKNLTRDDRGHFRWKINLTALYDNLEKILPGPDSDPVLSQKQFDSAPVLFVRGARSGYITAEDLPVIRRFFPRAEVQTLPDAGHWLHAEQPELFLHTVTDFLRRRENPI
jgi:pimeloyl-ACP methyl ester carboxylesterase